VTHKELGSPHFCHPNKKKSEQTENQQFFLDASRELRSQGRLLPGKLEIGRYRESKLMGGRSLGVEAPQMKLLYVGAL